MAGSAENGADFGASVPAGAGFIDAFVARLSPASIWLWATMTGGTNTDVANALDLDAAGTVWAMGYFTSTSISFGSIRLANPTPGHALFLARLAASPTATAGPAAAAPAFAGYPNPAREAVRLSGAAGTLAALLDALGREVRRQPLVAGAATLDLRGLPAGLYAVQCGGATRRLVVE